MCRGLLDEANVYEIYQNAMDSFRIAKSDGGYELYLESALVGMHDGCKFDFPTYWRGSDDDSVAGLYTDG